MKVKMVGVMGMVHMRNPRRARLLLVGLTLIASSFAFGCWMASSARGLTRDPAVAALVAGVRSHQSELRVNLGRLTGVAAVPLHGQMRSIPTRHAHSGAPIRTAQEYVNGRLRAFGLEAVRYQSYGAASTDRNVIGEIRGTIRPDEIIVVGAHLDDMPATGRAPGADDNASSCAALLYLAKHLADRDLARTVRFIFFGGEEVGHRGSSFAARVSRQGNENIVGMLNADAIGWNGSNSRVVEVHRRALNGSASRHRDLSIAAAFVRAISVYRITGIRARIMADGLAWSDHSAFWSAGYGAAWVIEDRRAVSNPFWHTRHDTMSNLSWNYLLSVTKALLATSAHLAHIQPRSSSLRDRLREPTDSPVDFLRRVRSRQALTFAFDTSTLMPAVDPERRICDFHR